MNDDEEARWAELDAAMGLADAGDLDGAEEQVRAYIEAYPEDLAGPAALEYLEDRRAGRAPHPRELEANEEAERVAREDAGFALSCLNCGHARHRRQKVLLNTRLMTFFRLDDLDRSALCLTCQTCGFIHWFGDANPGFFQTLHPDNHGPQEPPQRAAVGCLVCGHHEAVGRDQLLNTPWSSLLGLDFLNEKISAASCRRCGFYHWHAGGGRIDRLPALRWVPPADPLDPAAAKRSRERCLLCHSDRLEGREALLNTRFMTRVGLDWSNRAAVVVRCRDCGHISWYGDPS